MKNHTLSLLFSAVVVSFLLLGACAPGGIVNLAAGGDCPPGYVPVYDEQIGSAGSCQLNPNPPLTMTLPANGKCPPGYHRVYYLEFPQLDYCELDPTPTPQFQAPNPNLADLTVKSSMQIVQYCANQGGNLGGVNITFPDDKTLHVEDWLSGSPAHVKCVDDKSNPRTCWGPQSATFEVLLCNDTLAQNQSSSECETLPITLGACDQKHEGGDQPDAIATSCGHC